jgi:hypothetical protein
MSEKYTSANGDPVDMSQVTLGPRYRSEDMYRDMGIRVELLAKVREAIAAVGFDPADPDLYGMAEAAVDAVADVMHWYDPYY